MKFTALTILILILTASCTKSPVAPEHEPGMIIYEEGILGYHTKYKLILTDWRVINYWHIKTDAQVIGIHVRNILGMWYNAAWSLADSAVVVYEQVNLDDTCPYRLLIHE